MHPRLSQVAPLLLVIAGLVYVLGYLELQNSWWFEDDPFLYSYAGRITNPGKIFTDPQVVKGLSAGRGGCPVIRRK